MSYSGKKILMKVVGTMLAVAFALYIPAAEVHAEEAHVAGAAVQNDAPVKIDVEGYELPDDYFEGTPTARTMLTNCFILYACTDEGIDVDISTGAARTASVLGVKDIKIQKKVWYGWSTVASSDGYEIYNSASSGCSFVYTGAEEGETYRISCVHYGTVDEYTEVENETEPFVYQP